MKGHKHKKSIDHVHLTLVYKQYRKYKIRNVFAQLMRLIKLLLYIRLSVRCHIMLLKPRVT